jgi:TM2 domain-containing membrane protein YozV
MENKFCQNCGKKVDKNADICLECGVKIAKSDDKNSGIAAILSFLFIGLGQIYNGEIGKGISYMILGFLLALSMLVLVGFILFPVFYFYQIYDAYKVAENQ